MSMAVAVACARSPRTPHRWRVTDTADHAPRARVRPVVLPVTHGLHALDGNLPAG